MSLFLGHLDSSSKQKKCYLSFFKKLFLCCSTPRLLSVSVLHAVLSVSQSAHAQSPMVIDAPAKDAAVTRCADAANADNPDCQLLSVKKPTASQTKSMPRVRTQSALKTRENKLASSPPQPVTVQELTMYAGEVVVKNVGAIDRVAIGNGKIASTSVIDKTRLVIIAQDVGDTNILLWDKTKFIGEIRLRVTAQNLERVKSEARNLLSEIPGLKINNVGDRIFIEGNDLSASDLARVKVLAAQYPGIVDRTSRKSSSASISAEPADPSAMVMFDLYFVEFKKSYLQSLGIDWPKSFNGFGFGVYGEAASGPLLLRPSAGGSTPSTLPAGRVYGVSTGANVAISLPASINLAVDSGDAVLLAAPKIASRSGGKARFTAGGEVPLPSTSQQGTSVSFKSYGILLEVEPQINSDGSVSGIVNAEVSSVDPGITVMGIPGFLTRRTEANFHSKSGEAVVLSGLYSQDLSKSVSKVPLLGDIPLLGALFSSSSETRKNSELVVFIIPNVHSSGGAINSKVLGNTRSLIEERTKKLNGTDSDILMKLRPSPVLWGQDLLGGEAVGRPRQGSEPSVNVPLRESTDR